jgi:DNA invertase Pin-like site-specific DNA recombinase
MEEQEMSKRVACYARVSSVDGRQTTENQSLALKKFCEQKGWNYDLFEEKQSTMKTRPVKQHVLQALRHGRYETIIIWKLDRWARSSTELILEIKELHDKGINFISLTDHIDLSNASGKLMFQILSAFAEFERNLISERTKEGIKRAKEQGKKLGRPFGAKDRVKRKRSGYIIAQAEKSQRFDIDKGIFKPVESYIDARHSK